MRHVAVFIGLLLLTGPAFGQAGGTGSIQGTVTDPSGAIVVDASVRATNLATGVRTDRKTSEAGVFVLSLLPAGERRLLSRPRSIPEQLDRPSAHHQFCNHVSQIWKMSLWFKPK